MLKDLIKLANALDEKGLRKEADYLDAVIRKWASYPDDLDDLFVPNEQNTEFMPTDSYMKHRDYRTDKQMNLGAPPTHEGLPVKTKDSMPGSENNWDFDFSEGDEAIKSLVGTLIDQGRGLNSEGDLVELEDHSLRLLRELRGEEDEKLDDSFKEAFPSYVKDLGKRWEKEWERRGRPANSNPIIEELTEEFKRYLEQFTFGEDPSYDAPTGIDNLW